MAKKYPKELKKEVVQRWVAGESAIQLAREYDLSGKDRVYHWARQYKSGNTEFEETRGKLTKLECPKKGRQKIIEREDMTDAEYIKYLEMENDVLKKISEVEASSCPNKQVKLQTIKELSGKYPVTSLCIYLSISASTYYYFLKNKSQKYDRKVLNIIQKIYKNRTSTGYRTMKWTLEDKYNLIVNHKKIIRIMQFLNIKGKQYRRKYNFNKALQKSRTFPNILDRNFKSEKPNQKWSIDITYIPDIQRNTYLVCIKDLYDKRIVSYRNNNNMSQDFVLDCVKSAFEANNIKDNNLILHSDQGTHFSTNDYINLLNEFGVIGSHSRKGNCHDNSPIESFFSIFKREAFNFETPNDFTHTKALTDNFIYYYNNERVQYGLNKKTPYEFNIA